MLYARAQSPYLPFQYRVEELVTSTKTINSQMHKIQIEVEETLSTYEGSKETHES